MKYLSKFDNFINEQNTPKTVVIKGTDTVTKAEFAKQKIGDSFPNRIPQGGTIEALYKSDAVKKNIADLKPKIEQFIKDNPEQTKFVLTISAGESQVTNPDKFKTPGSLALARANAVKDYVNEIFADLIKSGKLTITSPKDEKDVKIGTTGYKDLNPQQRKDNADAYKTEQFVDIDLKGAGQKTVKGKDIVKTFCGKKVESGGEALLPQDGYAYRQVIKLGPGEGKMTVTLDSIKVPDILYVEYNGKTYGDSGLRGDDHLYNLVIGTAMYNAFGSNDKIPPAWGDKNKFKVLDANNPNDYEVLIGEFYKAAVSPLIWDWNSVDTEIPSDEQVDKWGSFYNTFGHSKSELKNDDIMQAMINYDKKTKGGQWSGSNAEKKVRRHAKDLVEDLKPFGMKWAILTSGISRGGYNIEIDKIDGVDELTIIDCAPCGATKWTGVINCGDQLKNSGNQPEPTRYYDSRRG